MRRALQGEGLTSHLRSRSLARRPRLRIGAVAALAIAAGLVAWLLLRSGGPTYVHAEPAHAVSAGDLAVLPSTVKHPVYWAGAQSGSTYEVSVTRAGLVFVRYLPPGVAVGAKRGYLTVGTYPVKDPLGAVRALAKRLGVTPVRLTGGGLAVQDTAHPTSVYFASPGSGYQVEVFDPSPAQARSLVLSGQVVPIGSRPRSAHAVPAPAAAATVDDLRRLAASAGHPVYWAGAEPRMTYEQTQTSDGRIYVRYLPPGVKAGSAQPFLTIGTYPEANAVAAIQAIAKRTGGRTFTVPGGGTAVVDPVHPTSVYLAFAGSNYEIEVFDPSAARARRIAASGGIVPVR